MAVIEEKGTVSRDSKQPHSVILEDRKKLTVTGVSDVDSFDEQSIIVYTGMGELTVHGSNLHISKLNTETGELNITGSVSGMTYTDDRAKGGFLSRMFR